VRLLAASQDACDAHRIERIKSPLLRPRRSDRFRMRCAGRWESGRHADLSGVSHAWTLGCCCTTITMSWVANVMILVDAADSASAEALSEWLRTDAPRRAQPEAHGVGFLKLLTSPETNQWGGCSTCWSDVPRHDGPSVPLAQGRTPPLSRTRRLGRRNGRRATGLTATSRSGGRRVGRAW
jgi:hypothetical protein